jgi:hypothetical protein
MRTAPCTRSPSPFGLGSFAKNYFKMNVSSTHSSKQANRKKQFWLMRTLPVFTLLAFSLNNASAQTAKGIVVDKDGQLPGATVRVSGKDIGCATELNGSFTLNTHSTGPVTLEISYLGASDSENRIESDRGNQRRRYHQTRR